MRWFLSIFVFLAVAAACFFIFGGEKNRDLRGFWSASSDGKTYLAIVDDNGGACAPLLIDKKPWPYKKGEAGPISAGSHDIRCGEGWSDGIGFEVPAGVVYHFDYWGP